MEILLAAVALAALALIAWRVFHRGPRAGDEPSGLRIVAQPEESQPAAKAAAGGELWHRVIFLDLETERLAEEVPGGWANIRDFGLAVACTYDDQNGYRFWHAPAAKALVEELEQFDRIVGFNVLRFDFEVLSAAVPDIGRRLGRKTVDMLADIERELGHRVGLDSLAEATLGERKSATGVLAVQWWRDGLRDRVRDYCRKDVEVTKGLYDYGCRNEAVYFMRNGERMTVRAGWGLARPAVGSGAYGYARRTLYPAVCAECGAKTEVPFLPRGHKPVYCSDCFQRRRSPS